MGQRHTQTGTLRHYKKGRMTIDAYQAVRKSFNSGSVTGSLTDPQVALSQRKFRFQTTNQDYKTMGLLDTILGAVTGKTDTSGGATPLLGILSGLLAQSGGLQGLAAKFSQHGQGDTFASWVGMGENQPISDDQVQRVLGSAQIQAIAARLGVDPNQASQFLAEYLPKIIDKLTPAGKIDPNADHQQGLVAMLPSLLQSMTGATSRGGSAPV